MRQPTACMATLIGLAALTPPALAEDESSAPSVGATALIAKSIRTYGHERLERSTTALTFRGTKYRIRRHDGVFTFERWLPAKNLHEVLTNNGFFIYDHPRSGLKVELRLPDEAQASRRRSLNSVVYFASIPLVLRDPAVQARRLSPVTIKKKRYETIEVRFSANDGGDDHDDVFRYWMDAATGRIDYMAYRFLTSGGGVRLRVASGTVTSAGVTFIQWENYGVDDKTVPLDALPGRWASGQLRRLSTIQLRDIHVRLE